MRRSMTATTTTLLVAASLLVVPTVAMAVPGGCAALAAAPLDRDIVVLEPVQAYAIPGDRYAAIAFRASTGDVLPATATYELCSDGYSVGQVRVEIPGTAGYVSPNTVATLVDWDAVVLDRQVRTTASLSPAVREHPSADAAKVADLGSGTFAASSQTWDGRAPLLGGSGHWAAVDIGGIRGFVDVAFIEDAPEPGSVAALELVDVVVTELGNGAPRIAPLVAFDPAAEPNPLLVGRGSVVDELRAGDVYRALPDLFEAQQPTPTGALAEAIAEAGADPELAPLLNMWRVVVDDDKFLYVPAWAVSDDRGLVQAAKDWLAEKAEKLEDLVGGLKNKAADRVDAPSAWSLFTLIPAGAAAAGALFLTGLALLRRVGFSIGRRLVGYVAVVGGPALSVVALTWVPAAAPWWAWGSGVGVLALSLLPAGLAARRLVSRRRRLDVADEPVPPGEPVKDAADGW